MSKLRPVDVSFCMPSNKLIDFPMLRTRSRLLCAQPQDYGYAADIAFLSLYAKEILAIGIPTISYSDIAKTKGYRDLENGLVELKVSVKNWDDNILPSIIAFPDKMKTGFGDIEYEFGQVDEKVKKIIKCLNYQDKIDVYVAQFQNHLDFLKENVDKEKGYLDNFIQMLMERQGALRDEEKKLHCLSNNVVHLTQQQQQQIDRIKKQISTYENSRKAAIAGACVTGILAGVVVAGGIASIIFVPGAGFAIGMVCFFGAGILAAGTGICTAQAIQLKEAIEHLRDTQTDVEKEKTAIALLEEQFNDFASRTEELVSDLKDMIENWNAVSQVLNNINYAVSKLNTKPTETEWQDVQNDLNSLHEIFESLEDGIQTMDVKTDLYMGCNLSNCTTEEEIMKALQEYAKKASNALEA